MPTALLLSDLAPDVIFVILGCCDIFSVVSIGQTCRYLHELALEKSVWLGLLEDLRRRSILDRTSDLQELSTDEMIRIVRRLITGPQTWSPEALDCDSVAEVSREITLHPVKAGDPPSEYGYKARLLPSGRYVLFTDWIWRHKSAIHSERTEVVEFAAEEIGIESATIMICVRTYPHPRNYVEMVSVNLRTGVHVCLLAARAPDTDFDVPFSDPVICGELAAVQLSDMDMEHDTYMVVNWRAQSYFILRDPDLQIALIPRYMILNASHHYGQQQIHLIANGTLDTYWAPIIGTDDIAEFSPIGAADIPKLSTLNHTDSRYFSRMYVHGNPIQDRDYRVWMCGTRYLRGSLSCYQLTIPITEHAEWRPQIRSALVTMGHPVCYSGHTPDYSLTCGWTVVSPCSSPGLVRLNWQFPEEKHIDITPYSGALTYVTRTTIVIQYYK
ncbi:hypothetical protein MSAN_01523400 [Mycena sanguinolenta]|uniref:F-box domain-containing protein n=1 Tax=Mycena sanguinolenta TaxID=230812 RepID=A0A8H7CWX4_9AGAR|nr:hypothetical protein MSAN_01523400 [Mycena sanguinolenta]